MAITFKLAMVKLNIGGIKDYNTGTLGGPTIIWRRREKGKRILEAALAVMNGIPNITPKQNTSSYRCSGRLQYPT